MLRLYIDRMALMNRAACMPTCIRFAHGRQGAVWQCQLAQ